MKKKQGMTAEQLGAFQEEVKPIAKELIEVLKKYPSMEQAGVDVFWHPDWERKREEWGCSISQFQGEEHFYSSLTSAEPLKEYSIKEKAQGDRPDDFVEKKKGPKARKVRVVIARPGEKAFEDDRRATRETFRRIVQGELSYSFPIADDIVVFSNQNAREFAMEENRWILDDDGGCTDLYYGPIVFVGLDAQNRFRSLSDSEVLLIQNLYGNPCYGEESEEDDWGDTDEED